MSEVSVSDLAELLGVSVSAASFSPALPLWVLFAIRFLPPRLRPTDSVVGHRPK